MFLLRATERTLKWSAITSTSTMDIFQIESSAPEEFKGVVYSGEAPESDDGMLAAHIELIELHQTDRWQYILQSQKS